MSQRCTVVVAQYCTVCNDADMNTLPKDGLRDRKRMQTRARLEEAAVTLVLRDGLEQTTVGAISELADVSPRTFFNYFDSKDSAILGLRHLEITDESAMDFVADDDGGDLVGSVVHLLFAVMDAPLSRPTIRKDRMEIIRRYPQILGGQLAQMTLMAGRLTDAVQGLLAREPRFSGQPTAEQAAAADLILAMCGGAVRVAIRERAEAGRGAADEELEQRAVALVRDIVEKLQ
jgi:AcrR family transcriptional regulator